jgi:hypothetical protein
MLNEWPFLSSVGQEGVPSDFRVFGAITLRDFCQKWSIPMTASDIFNLFFVDSEGTRNANEVNEQPGKALITVLAISTVRIAMRRRNWMVLFVS